MANRRARGALLGTVLLLILLATLPLVGPPPKGDDALLHYFRIPAVLSLWQHGIFFARWLPDLVYGYGSPLFNFYPPLSAYLLTILYQVVGQNGPLAYNIAFALTLALTAIFMLLLGRHLFGDGGGLLAAAAYTLSPQVLLQTYGRGSLSNALALAFAPLVTLALLRLAQRPAGRRIAVVAIALTLLFLSHAAASLLFLPVLLALGIGASQLLYPRKTTTLIVIGSLLGLSLAAFMWLPGLAELGLTRYAASVTPDKVDFRQHFANLLAWPPVMVAGLTNPPLPRNIGLFPLLGGGTATIVAGWQLGRKWHRASNLAGIEAFVLLAGLLGLAVLFFTIPISAWFWEHLDALRQVQFPWRLLDLPAFLLALAAGSWAVLLRGRLQQAVLASALVIIFLNAVPYFYPPRLVSLPRQPSLADVTWVQQEYGILGLTAWGEYSSVVVSRWPSGPAFAGMDRGAALADKIRLTDQVELLYSAGGLLRATWLVEASAETWLPVEVHRFPGWRATVDEQPVPLAVGSSGQVQIPLRPGEHRVVLFWDRTPIRWLADGLSFIALLVTLLLFTRGLPSRTERPLEHSSGLSLWLVGLLGLLVLLKVGVLDQSSTPLVVHPSAGQVPGTQQADWRDFGAIRLAGYEIDRPDRLTLYWYAAQAVNENFTIRVMLRDAQGVPVKEIFHSHPGANVTSTWEAGQFTRDVYQLPLAEREPPVGYYLDVAVLNSDTEQPLPLQDAPPGITSASVGTLKRSPAPVAVPPHALPVGARLGAALELSYVLVPDRVKQGSRLPLTLFWRAEAPVTADYTVFIHLVRPDGSLAAGNDGQPVGGIYPTSFWDAGEMIVDFHPWTLAVPPGSYQIEVGLYDLESGARLPVSESASGLPDRVVVQQIQVYSE